MRTNLNQFLAALLLVGLSFANISPVPQLFMVSLSNHTLRAVGLEEGTQKNSLSDALKNNASGLEEAVVLDASVPYQYPWRTAEFDELWPNADDRDPKLERFQRLFNQDLDGHPEGEIQLTSPNGNPDELARWIAENNMTPQRVAESIEWIHKMHPYDKERFISLQQLPSIQAFLAAHPEARFNLIGVREDESKVGSFKIGQYMDEYLQKILKAGHRGDVNFPGAVMYSSGNAIQGDVETLAWLKEQGLVPQDFKITMVAMAYLKPKKRKMIEDFKKRGLVDRIVTPEEIAAEYLADSEGGSVPVQHQDLAVDPVALDDINQVLKLLDWWSEKQGRAHIYASNSLSAVVGGARIYYDINRAFTQDREYLQALLGDAAETLPAQPDGIVMPAAGGGPFGGIPFWARQLGHATKTIGPIPTIRTGSIAEGLGIQMIQELARNLARLLGVNQMQLTEVSERAILKAFVELHDAGIEVEPSSAIAYAQVLYLMENKPEFFSQFLAENGRPMTLVAILTGRNFEPSDAAWAWAKVQELRLKEPHALRADPTQRQAAVPPANGLQQVVVLSSGTEQAMGRALRQAVIDWRASQPANLKPTVTAVYNPPKDLDWLKKIKPDVILVAATAEEAQQDGLLRNAITVLGDAGVLIRYVPFPSKVARSLNPLAKSLPGKLLKIGELFQGGDILVDSTTSKPRFRVVADQANTISAVSLQPIDEQGNSAGPETAVPVADLRLRFQVVRAGLEEQLLTVTVPPSQPVWLTAADGIQLLERLLQEGESRSIYSVKHGADFLVPRYRAVVSKEGGVIKVRTVGKFSMSLEFVMTRVEGYFIVKPDGNIFVIDAEDGNQRANIYLRKNFSTISVDSLAPAAVEGWVQRPSAEEAAAYIRELVPQGVSAVQMGDAEHSPESDRLVDDLTQFQGGAGSGRIFYLRRSNQNVEVLAITAMDFDARSIGEFHQLPMGELLKKIAQLGANWFVQVGFSNSAARVYATDTSGLQRLLRGYPNTTGFYALSLRANQTAFVSNSSNPNSSGLEEDFRDAFSDGMAAQHYLDQLAGFADIVLLNQTQEALGRVDAHSRDYLDPKGIYPSTREIIPKYAQANPVELDSAHRERLKEFLFSVWENERRMRNEPQGSARTGRPVVDVESAMLPELIEQGRAAQRLALSGGLEERVNLLVIRDSNDAATKQALLGIVPGWAKTKASQEIDVVSYGTLDKGLAASPKKGRWSGILMLRHVATEADVDEIERQITGLKPVSDSAAIPVALIVYASDQKVYEKRLLGSLQLLKGSQGIVTFFVHRLWQDKPASQPAVADSPEPTAKPAVPPAGVFTGVLDQLLDSAAKYAVAVGLEERGALLPDVFFRRPGFQFLMEMGRAKILPADFDVRDKSLQVRIGRIVGRWGFSRWLEELPLAKVLENSPNGHNDLAAVEAFIARAQNIPPDYFGIAAGTTQWSPKKTPSWPAVQPLVIEAVAGARQNKNFELQYTPAAVSESDVTDQSDGKTYHHVEIVSPPKIQLLPAAGLEEWTVSDLFLREVVTTHNFYTRFAQEDGSQLIVVPMGQNKVKPANLYLQEGLENPISRLVPNPVRLGREKEDVRGLFRQNPAGPNDVIVLNSDIVRGDPLSWFSAGGANTQYKVRISPALAMKFNNDLDTRFMEVVALAARVGNGMLLLDYTYQAVDDQVYLILRSA